MIHACKYVYIYSFSDSHERIVKTPGPEVLLVSGTYIYIYKHFC